MVYHIEKLLKILVFGFISHHIEVKKDTNHPTHLTHKYCITFLKFSEYNQQRSLITYKFFNKYFTFPLNST